MKIYLDQNIISKISNNGLDQFIRNNNIDLNEVEFFYSYATFIDIKKGKIEQNKTLSVLRDLRAKYLEMSATDLSKPLDYYEKNRFPCKLFVINDDPEDIFKKVNFTACFDEYIAMLNGGKTDKDGREIVANVFATITQESSTELNDYTQRAYGLKVQSIIDQNCFIINKLIEENEKKNAIERKRQSLGFDSKERNKLPKEKTLQAIIDILKSKHPELADILLKEKDVYYFVVYSCSIFDQIGFESEAKCRKLASISNICADSYHIFYASLCDKFYTNDKKLKRRAEVIYEYLDLKTVIISIK